MAPVLPTQISWQQQHTALTRGMIYKLLTSRSSFYRLEGLHGQVDNHGGNRISQRVIDTCKKMARDAGMDQGVVQEIINQTKGIKRAREGSLGGGGQGGEVKEKKAKKAKKVKKDKKVKDEI